MTVPKGMKSLAWKNFNFWNFKPNLITIYIEYALLKHRYTGTVMAKRGETATVVIVLSILFHFFVQWLYCTLHFLSQQNTQNQNKLTQLLRTEVIVYSSQNIHIQL